MELLRKRGEVRLYQRLTLPWEEKHRLDPFLTWNGSYRWFRSENIIPLERYQDSETMARVRSNVLSKVWHL